MTGSRFRGGRSARLAVMAAVLAALVTGATITPVAAVAAVASGPVALTIAMEPYGTFGPRPHDAVARAVITCDRTTSLAVGGKIEQPGISGGHHFTTWRESDWCRPDAPLEVFVPARSASGPGSFAAGPATAAVWARTPGPIFGTEATTAVRTVTLIDQTALERFIAGAVQAGDATVAKAVSEAVATRSWQDPLFVGRHDRVVVTGAGFFVSDIHIDARSGPSGENPTGTGSFVVFDVIEVHGPVTCLNITGAGMGFGQMLRPKTATVVIANEVSGNTVAVTVVDRGDGGTFMALDTPRSPTDCTPVQTFDQGLAGRVVVFDALPLR